MADENNVNDEYLLSLGKLANAGDDIAFMNIIKTFPCLYNRHILKFKDKPYKENAWQQITKLMNLDPELGPGLCKTRYENIRTYLSRHMKKKRTCQSLGGGSNHEVILDERFEHLRWLVGFIKSRSYVGGSMKRKLSSETKDDECEEEIEEGEEGGSRQGFCDNIGYGDDEKNFTDNISMTSPSLVPSMVANDRFYREQSSSNQTNIQRTTNTTSINRDNNDNNEIWKAINTLKKSMIELQNQPTQNNNTVQGMSSDKLYCLSLEERMKDFDSKTKAYIRHSIEKIFLDVENGAVKTTTI